MKNPIGCLLLVSTAALFQSKLPRYSESSVLVCSTLPSSEPDTAVPRAELSCWLVFWFWSLYFLCGCQLNIGVRNVYFYGFEPREGDEPTRSRLKSKNQHFRALCFSLISSAWSPGNLAWAEWIPGTDKSPALKVQIAHGCLGSQEIIKPWEPSKNQGLVVTVVLSRHLSMSCYKIPSQYWDLISKVRKTIIHLKLTEKNLFRIEIISWKTWLLEIQGCQRMKLVKEKKV